MLDVEIAETVFETHEGGWPLYLQRFAERLAR